LFYLERGPKNSVFWLLLGTMMWLRPDTILIGIGIFIVECWFTPRPLTAQIARGIYFSAPILLFLLANYFLFGNPLPSPFYIKGWNKSLGFSPTLSLDREFAIGLTHLFSGFFASFLVALFVFIGLWQLIRSAKNRHRYQDIIV
jgi:hypothetical protein